jgi:hypothetical protein
MLFSIPILKNNIFQSIPLPRHLARLSTVACPPERCEPEMHGHCTAELCDDYREGDLMVAAKLVHSAALVMLSNDTRIRRTAAGVPCNSLTCQPQYRHWGCDEDLCANINVNVTNDDEDDIGMQDNTNETEWLTGRSDLSPWMSADCLQRCHTPQSGNDMEACPVQVCREYLQEHVRACMKQ